MLQQNVAPDDRLRLEVNISIEGEQVGVLGASLLPLVADRQLHDLVAEQVVHVHDLRPPKEEGGEYMPRCLKVWQFE